MRDVTTLTVAYLANQFPSPVEPYVVEEIEELRRRGIRVIASSARQSEPNLDAYLQKFAAETLYVQKLSPGLLAHAAWLCLTRFHFLAGLIVPILRRGRESLGQRLRALLHTWLGVCYALQLRGRGVQHIHVHHGYFSSRIAMVAARLCGISFSLTLHGSDLLLHPAFLDTKLAECKFCLTISEFNRSHILHHYPRIDPNKILLRRMGTSAIPYPSGADDHSSNHLVILAVGRLHPVKDHAFLLRACRKLKERSVPFRCWIAGDGPERASLDKLICDLDLQENVTLLGHLCRAQLDSFYAACDLVALTSRSEGLPLVLMEAMAHGKLVLAPAITGIPELVIPGKTGFLYRPGSLDDFVLQVQTIHSLRPALAPLRRAAQGYVLEHFDRTKNLARFGDVFVQQLAIHPQPAKPANHPHADSLLQQI
jgi:glycosyltransferase involved in cell wall biosynthesis